MNCLHCETDDVSMGVIVPVHQKWPCSLHGISRAFRNPVKKDHLKPKLIAASFALAGGSGNVSVKEMSTLLQEMGEL